MDAELMTVDKSAIFRPRVKQLEGELGYLGHIRSLLARRSQEIAKLKGQDVPDDFVFEIISESVCDADGNLIATKEQVAEQIDILTANDLFTAILDFNRLSKSTDEAKAELKNARKTSS